MKYLPEAQHGLSTFHVISLNLQNRLRRKRNGSPFSLWGNWGSLWQVGNFRPRRVRSHIWAWVSGPSTLSSLELQVSPKSSQSYPSVTLRRPPRPADWKWAATTAWLNFTGGGAGPGVRQHWWDHTGPGWTGAKNTSAQAGGRVHLLPGASQPLPTIQVSPPHSISSFVRWWMYNVKLSEHAHTRVCVQHRCSGQAASQGRYTYPKQVCKSRTNGVWFVRINLIWPNMKSSSLRNEVVVHWQY